MLILDISVMELLIDLYKISSPSGKKKAMIKFITGKLDELGIDFKTDSLGNIYATKGEADSYPCVVSHTDEVHSIRGEGYRVINVRGEMILGHDSKRRRMTGIGADDKNGIWICLKCLEEFEIMKCAFFVGEEVGCYGSGRANMEFFKDCRFILQCDRKGDSDLITEIAGIKLCSRKFLKAISPKDYGYKENSGLQTDVHCLKRRGVNVSCVNISCGYYNPHTDEEYTVIEDLNKCLAFVRHIISDCGEVYTHQYSPPKPIFNNHYERYGFGFNRFPRDFDDFGDDLFPRPQYNIRSSSHAV